MGQTASKQNGISDQVDNTSDSETVSKTPDDLRRRLGSFRAPLPVKKPAFLPMDNLNRNWVLWSLRNERIRKLYLKHSEKFGGEFFSRYGMGELFFEKISDPETVFDTSIFFQLLHVETVKDVFSAGVKQDKKRLVIGCKEINTAENLKTNDDEKRVKLIAENELADILAYILVPGDLLVIFGDFNIQSAKTIFLNSRFQHPISIAHMRFMDDYTDFDTSESIYTNLRSVMRRGMVESEFHVFGNEDQALCIRPTEAVNKFSSENLETNAGKNDTGKSDAGKNDTGKSDAGKNDIGKSDAGKNDAGTNGVGTNAAAKRKLDSYSGSEESNKPDEADIASNENAIQTVKVPKRNDASKKKIKDSSRITSVKLPKKKKVNLESKDGSNSTGERKKAVKRRMVSANNKPKVDYGIIDSSSESDRSSSHASWASSSRQSKLKRSHSVTKDRPAGKNSVPDCRQALPARRESSGELERVMPCTVRLKRLSTAELEHYGIRVFA